MDFWASYVFNLPVVMYGRFFRPNFQYLCISTKVVNKLLKM